MRRRTDAARMQRPAARPRAPPATPGTIIRGKIPRTHTEVSMKRSTHGPGTGHQTGTTGEAGSFDPPTQRGDSMVNVQSIDDLARRLAAMVPPGLKEARDDLA